MADYHPAVEEYLETILELEESGVPAMRARLVDRLGVSAPAVSQTVGRLEREGYLTLDDKNVMHLTESGREYATAIMRRHRLAERLLVDVLKVPWHQIHDEACRLEHAISENLEKHLIALLGDPGTCPHGNPIPGSANMPVGIKLKPLSTLGTGGSSTVRRIDEELESLPERMLELETTRLVPGAEVTVETVGAQYNLLIDGKPHTIDRIVLERVYVDAS